VKGLHFDDGGKGGVPVVLHHGLGADLHVWDSALADLRQTRRAIAFDMRGHGKSPRADEYTVGAAAEDLDELVSALGVDHFWLVGHSFAGGVLSAYAGLHPKKLAGLVYVDALGDLTRAPAAMRAYFREHDAGMTPEKLQAAYGEMLGPKAKLDTRVRVLESAARMDLPAFAALRASMSEFPAEAMLTRYRGPRRAIDVEGNDFPFLASKMPGFEKPCTVPKVSHWLMLDDPAAFNAALTEVLR
jgi:pimeloyl-ACP methyl ester carboxylesterase